MGLVGAYLLCIAIVFRVSVVRKLKALFTEPSHPQNLAMFRIAVFVCLILSRFGSDAIFFSDFPRVLMHPPLGTAWFVRHLPRDHQTVTIAYWLMMGFCWTALLGLFTRTSCLMAAVLGVYVLGVQQLFGKVTHCHHLFWFPLVLAFSRCGDVLSLDAIWYAWKRADRGQVAPPTESILYGLPLRAVWVLIGVLYFFPGFWKLFDGGFAWIYSDNLLNRMHKAWMLVGVPAVRLDHWPLFCKVGAAFSIGFELTVIVLIFWKATRRLAVMFGLGFHNFTGIFMGIWFWTLQMCYTAFVNWRWLVTTIGHRLFPQPLRVLYDGQCKLCRRTIATIASFDLLGRIEFLNAMDRPAVSQIADAAVD